MSKGTKKLDRALGRAIRYAQGVVREMNDRGEAGSGADAVFDEGRMALDEAGIVLWHTWEYPKFDGTDCLVRVTEVKHVSSGQFRIVRSPRYIVDHLIPFALAVSGISSLSLCYMVRDLLMLPRARPAPPGERREEPTGTLHDRNERPERQAVLKKMLGRAKSDYQPPEETESKIRSDIEMLLLQVSDEVGEEAREEMAGTGVDCVLLRALRDALLSQSIPRDAVHAAENVPDASRDINPANTGDPTEEEQLLSFDFDTRGDDPTVPEEVTLCPEQERREGVPLEPAKQVFIDPLPPGSEELNRAVTAGEMVDDVDF